MTIDERTPKNAEQAVAVLRELYGRYGYTQYKMSKFEEYDLYMRNKDFLVGDGVITFTDTDGKLMALKPDVTLSIVKNSKDGVMQKVYYHENVYRISRSTHTFKEIMQTGLECIGDIDTYATAEALFLAKKSLAAIGRDYILNISHLGVLSAAVEDLGLSLEAQRAVITCVGEKNTHGIRAVCLDDDADETKTETLVSLVGIYGEPCCALENLSALPLCEGAREALSELHDVIEALDASGELAGVNVDFSVTGDMNYYSGIVFRGFIEGIPDGVLSGGRYDKLMEKMGRRAGAIGFAVYLDLLERLDTNKKEFDTDILFLYGKDDAPGAVLRAVSDLSGGERRVLAVKKRPEHIRYRELVIYRNGGFEILEKND